MSARREGRDACALPAKSDHGSLTMQLNTTHTLCYCVDGQVVPVMLHLITRFSSLRIHLPADLRPADARNSVFKTINEIKRRFPDGTYSPINTYPILLLNFR